MLNNEDVKKLLEVFATREEIKEMIDKLSQKRILSISRLRLMLMLKRLIFIFKKWLH